MSLRKVLEGAAGSREDLALGDKSLILKELPWRVALMLSGFAVDGARCQVDASRPVLG